MLYSAYEMQKAWLSGASALASESARLIEAAAAPFAFDGGGAVLASALEVFAHAAAPRGKPAFGLSSVREEIVVRKPFGQLKRFVRDGQEGAPKLLIVAPMSGHYATLLRGTVERMVPDHDVYITDWRDARAVPPSSGLFDLDDYIDYLVSFMEAIGPGAHMLAVCQPSVPCLAAAALLSANQNPARPRTLTMMGGPIDTRRNPTSVNLLAQERPYAWFANSVIAKVPAPYDGAGRSVYPGFLQLSGFMSMNLANHMMSHWEMFKQLVNGDDESADATKAFYEEYRSVCDMTAEFYLQTIDVVFQRHLLPKGEMMHRGHRVDLSAISDIAILAIEGERDDISGIGQTKAALDLTPALPDAMKHYHLAEGAGHYGIFNGGKWRDQIAPVVEQWIAQHN
jgi:poly(3-hydroxybutyrate) depolymerase